MQSRKFLRTAGGVFGAWLGLVYAYIAVEINRAALPGVRLPEPLGGVLGYYLAFLAAGAFLGVLTCWPEHTLSGMALGMAAGIAAVFILPWKNALNPMNQTLTSPNFFIIPIFCLLPVTLFIRQAAQSLPAQPGGGRILRQIGWPVAATALAILLGIFSLYPPEVKDDLQTTQYWVQLGLQSTTTTSLPKPFRNVQNWLPNATGDFTLEWYSANSPMNSFAGIVLTANDILIVVRCENNFSVACIFLSGAKTPNCTNFE